MMREAATLLIVLSLAGVGSSGEAAVRPARIYDPARNPLHDLEAALIEAARDDKRVLVEVGGNWCGWCRELERFVRSDASVSSAFRCSFVTMRVNVSDENPNADFLRSFPPIAGYPHLFVLDASGKLLASIDGDELVHGESYDRRLALQFARRWEAPAR